MNSKFWQRIAWFIIVLLLAGCGLLPVTNSPAEATAVSPQTTPDAAATPDAVTPPSIANTPSFEIPEPTPAAKSSLIIWLPPAIASRTEAGAVVFSDQLLAFNSIYPDLIISVEQKSATGQGGILNYLRTGQNVAPSILPDLIALPVGQLTAVAEEGLIYPLEDVLDPALTAGLYPAAQSWTSFNDHFIAYPFAITELPQLEFSPSLTSAVPLQWRDFITDTEQTMVFPAAGTAGAKLALQFYLQAGGSLTNEAGQPMLELEPLTLALQQLNDGRENGFILQQSSNLSTLNEARLLVQNGAASFALSSSDEYLIGRTEEIIPGSAAIPGLDAPLTPLVRGWAWVITTPDPAEKALAAELIAMLTAPEQMGTWSLNSRILPANPEAFAQWPETDDYLPFIRPELERAEPMPLADTSPVMQALGDAVFDVISLARSPAEAAADAVDSLQPQP
jgi:ABC-type glycerol-3-phosphate transport system substrate-binding protein